MSDETPSAAIDSGVDRTLQTGDLLTPKYEVVRTIGSGGMGVVYEAKNRQTHARVAIKMLRARALGVEGAVARFSREARATGMLRSPHVARVLDADTTSEHVPFLVMEYYEGTDLHSELHSRGWLPIGETCGHVLQACAGLSEAHAAGIVHRDLKPSNLFLSREGAERRLRILDFGVSKHLASEEELTETAASVGTPNYMAPEQVRDAKHVDHRADIWALGVILYRCLTGRAPFRGTTSSVAVAIATEAPLPPRSFVPELPEALDALVMRALEKDPSKRFADVGALALALAPFADQAIARAALAEIALHQGRKPAVAAAVVGDAEETSAPVTGERRSTRARAPWIALAAILAAAIAFVALRRAPEPTPAAPPPVASPQPTPVASATPGPASSPSPSVSIKTAPSVSVKTAPKPFVKKKPRLEDPDLLP